jgi:hypothetical protein
MRAQRSKWIESITVMLLASIAPISLAQAPPIKVSSTGVYEVVVGVDQARHELLKTHFEQFGFAQVAEARLTEAEARARYGVQSALRSVRMQNGAVDSHGLLRIVVWNNPLGPGVGYAPPETIGQRLSVLMVRDIVRLDDIFNDARAAGESWLPIKPVFADLYGQTEGKPGLIKRRVGVRESGVYGELFNHVFFQRYGYQIAGYGTLNEMAPLIASEFTHHDFIIAGDINQSTQYVVEVLGFREENAASLDGDWLEGPRKVFGMAPGATHWYRGFVSSDNICGKLKFFAPRDIRTDRSQHQRLGELGITMHSVRVNSIELAHQKAVKSRLRPRAIERNEFGERSFVFIGTDGSSWQVLEAAKHENAVSKELVLKPVSN